MQVDGVDAHYVRYAMLPKVSGGIQAVMEAWAAHPVVRRIHRHDPKIYVDTLDTAFCAMRQLQQRRAPLPAVMRQVHRDAREIVRVSATGDVSRGE